MTVTHVSTVPTVEGDGGMPTGVEPVIACRTWGVYGTEVWRLVEGNMEMHGGTGPPPGPVRLTSPVQSFVVWNPGEPITATCCPTTWTSSTLTIDAVHLSPDPGCTCGIYAVRPELLHQQWAPLEDHCRVYGEVALWGTVIEKEHGWVGEHAYPHAFFDPGTRFGGPLAHTAGQVYDVPVVQWPDWATPFRPVTLLCSPAPHGPSYLEPPV